MAESNYGPNSTPASGEVPAKLYFAITDAYTNYMTDASTLHLYLFTVGFSHHISTYNLVKKNLILKA
jgi:hypothetical protein